MQRDWKPVFWLKRKNKKPRVFIPMKNWVKLIIETNLRLKSFKRVDDRGELCGQIRRESKSES